MQAVVVAALTYRRPEMLAQLLATLPGLERPEGCAVQVLIVDNDPVESAKRIVDRYITRFGGNLHYVVEPEPGIPIARNRAMREASKQGAELLAFIDDDEIPDPQWLSELVRHKEATGAVLVGGPCRLLPAVRRPDRLWSRFLASSLVARSAFLERRWSAKARNGAPPFIATNNWWADLEGLLQHGIAFDTRMQYTGGSDTALFNSVKNRGGRVSWCPSAVVYEHLQPERLSLRYDMKRSRSQAIVRGQLSSQPAWRTVLEQAARAIVGGCLMIVPVLGSASFTIGAHMIAVAAGRFAQLRGGESRLYQRSSDAPSSGSRME